MKYILYILIGLIAATLVYLIFFNGGAREPANDQPLSNVMNGAPHQWETRVDDQPPVTVTITPIDLERTLALWRFAVTFDTHAGSLDHDPAQVVTLSDDKGNTYQPLSWEGPGAGGHHRTGSLVFHAITPTPPFVELKVKNVGGIPERLFTWSLETVE